MPAYAIDYPAVVVNEAEIAVERLPTWSDLLNDLPIGAGVKGGIARKILKVIAGLNSQHTDMVAELNGDGDVDILVAVGKVSPELSRQLRHQFTGKTLGDMVVEPKDIEVNDNLARYFLTRDVTMNEALVMRVSHDRWVMYYTEQAMQDVKDGVIRPSTHCLHTGFAQNWFWDEKLEGPILAAKPLARCLIRYLKGHGVAYGIDAKTWHYYQYCSPLPPEKLFLVLKAFMHDDEKFHRCVQHLKDIGLVAPATDANHLWGEAFFAMNQKLAMYGRRLTFTEPDADQIEDWIQSKREQYRRWQERRASLQAIGRWVEDDGVAEVILPPGHPQGYWSRYDD